MAAADSGWDSLPPLPKDKLAASTNIELSQDGNDCVSRDPYGHTTDAGTFLNFTPAAGELAWAVYSFYCGSHNATGISVSPQPNGQDIYIGYSDYAVGRWVFSGPFNVPAQPDPAADIELPLESSRLSPLGYLHVVIAVAGSSASAVIKQVNISVSNWQDGQMNLAAQDSADFALAEIANRPAIAYVEESGTLKFVRAAVPDGSSWDAPVTVLEGTFGTFRSVSLAEVAGRPAIAVHDPKAFGASLEFIRALDASGSNWPTLSQTVVESSSDVYCGSKPSLAALDGFTGIAFRGADDVLGYALSNEDATDPWFPLTVDDSATGVTFSTLRLVNGHPAICYIEVGDGIANPDLLQYAYSASLSGVNSLDWTIVTVDETSNAFGTGWLYFNWINDSFPAVVYKNGGGSRFKYAYATSASGLDAWVEKEIDPTVGSVALGLVTDNGLPAIMFRDQGDTAYMRALDSSGNDWATPFSICPASSGGAGVDLINGQPAIAYTANSNPNILAYTYRP